VTFLAPNPGEATVAVDLVVAKFVQEAGADPENELGGDNSGVTSGVQGRRPGRESGGRSSPEADDFSQFKGYLDVI